MIPNPWHVSSQWGKYFKMGTIIKSPDFGVGVSMSPPQTSAGCADPTCLSSSRIRCKTRAQQRLAFPVSQNFVLSPVFACDTCPPEGVLLSTHNSALWPHEGFYMVLRDYSRGSMWHRAPSVQKLLRALTCAVLFWRCRACRGTAALQSYQAHRCRGTELLDLQRRGRGKRRHLAMYVSGCSLQLVKGKNMEME